MLIALIVRARVAALLTAAALAVAGCSSFGGSKGAKPEAAVDPNVYPANYRRQVVDLLTTMLTDRADFRGTLIAPPALKPFGENQHYVVCLQFNGHNERKEKAVLFLDGTPTQFVDAKPEQCADAAYQPFKELEEMTPGK